MKKQLLLIICGLSITTSAFCMQEENKKPCSSAAADAVASYLERAKEGVEAIEASPRTDQTSNHYELLRQLNIDAQLVRKSIDTCSKSAFESKNFAHDHMVLSIHASNFYAKYLAEKQKAKICVNAPAYHALLSQADLLLDISDDAEALSDQEKFLKGTLAGLVQTLSDAQLNAHVKVHRKYFKSPKN